MKPTWNQLGDSFKDSKTVIIGDVDCTVEKDLCGQFGVRGYPTIKYFTGSTAAEGDKYEGGRDFDSLKAFADENLGPSCDAGANFEMCDADQKATIAEAKALGLEGIEAFIQEKVDAIAEAEQFLKDEVQKLQDRYQSLNSEKDDKIKDLSPKLRMYRSVVAALKSPATGHDEL